MSSSSFLQITIALTVLIAVTSAELCSPPTIAIPAVQVQARYQQTAKMTGEYQGPQPLLIRWTRQIYNPDFDTLNDVPIVSYSLAQGNNSWADSSGPRTYAAVYVYRQEINTISYELQIRRASCESIGTYTCHFLTNTDCSITFNVSVTVPPSPPVMRNRTIRADSGTAVDILCEANVGYPAVDILWYFVPADGSNIRQITEGITTNTTSTDDCREYKISTLRVTVNNEDQNGKFRCRTMDKFGGSGVDHFADGRVAINDQGNSAGQGLSAIVIHIAVLVVAMFVLCD